MKAPSFQQTRKNFRALVGVIIFCSALFFTSACATSAPAPTAISNAPTVILPITANAPTIPLPTLLPTVDLGITQPAQNATTEIPTITPVPQTATGPASTRPPGNTVHPSATPGNTTSETATPFPEGMPKVYVTALRVEPATPKADVGGTFFVTFQNASGENQAYNWAVEIWDADNNRRPFGLTTPQNSAMPVGVSNFISTGWTVKGLGECHGYRARVIARDEDDNRVEFIQPDGTILWIDFSVCP